MVGEKRVICPWCQTEGEVRVAKEKSDHAGIVLRRCAECGQVISAYLDEEMNVLEKVRTFPTPGTT